MFKFYETYFLESKLIHHENVGKFVKKKNPHELNCSSCNCASSVMNRIVCDWFGPVYQGILSRLRRSQRANNYNMTSSIVIAEIASLIHISSIERNETRLHIVSTTIHFEFPLVLQVVCIVMNQCIYFS